jgi:hypothetical protein
MYISTRVTHGRSNDQSYTHISTRVTHIKYSFCGNRVRFDMNEVNLSTRLTHGRSNLSCRYTYQN